MTQWIWQNPDWPSVYWDTPVLEIPIKEVRLLQGKLAGLTQSLTQDTIIEYQSQILCDDLIETSAIEGEILNRDSVRSSVVRRLQLDLPGFQAGAKNYDPYIEGLISILLDATENATKAMSLTRLLNWHKQLFQQPRRGIFPVTPGKLRKEPVFVVSGYAGREQVHFEGPPAETLRASLLAMVKWINKESCDIDGIVRAGIAHFMFIVIHPFDDGNGRIARALSDWALAQDEQASIRLYSFSAEIMRNKKDYYNALKASTTLNLDVTQWLLWFIDTIKKSIECSLEEINLIVAKARFWQTHKDNALTERQIKVINKLLDAGPEGFEGGLSTRKYVGITKTSRATAQREISDLVKKKYLRELDGRGRSTAYEIIWQDQEKIII
jgi:Fic family protein